MAQELPKHRAREYETIFIVNPESTTEQLDQISGRMTDVISRLEGKLLRAENWGKRRLAFPIAKQNKGTYIYLHYLGYADMVHEIERNMRMIEPVMKYLTVKIDEDVNPEARPVRDEDISFAPLFEDEVEDDIAAEEEDSEVGSGDDDYDGDDDDNDDDDDGDDRQSRKPSSKTDENDDDDTESTDDTDDEKNED